MAKLGRKHVSALVKGDVELLSDIQGILYTRMDQEEFWKIEVDKELRVAGIDE